MTEQLFASTLAEYLTRSLKYPELLEAQCELLKLRQAMESKLAASDLKRKFDLQGVTVAGKLSAAINAGQDKAALVEGILGWFESVRHMTVANWITSGIKTEVKES